MTAAATDRDVVGVALLELLHHGAHRWAILVPMSPVGTGYALRSLMYWRSASDSERDWMTPTAAVRTQPSILQVLDAHVDVAHRNAAHALHLVAHLLWRLAVTWAMLSPRSMTTWRPMPPTLPCTGPSSSTPSLCASAEAPRKLHMGGAFHGDDTVRCPALLPASLAITWWAMVTPPTRSSPRRGS